ncbi:ribosome biogenesis GTPase Der [Candidatus Falkowbacteria bacterium]|nr:ribosome biogenesis GTPase Der [Candidatus Falkowbacteria bacterium]
MNEKKLPLVVVFGRTNVGKSTLFNTLTEKKKALVSNIAGTTRDSNVGQVEWLGKKFEIIDTGGIMDDIQNASQKKLKQLLKDEKGKESLVNLKVQKQAISYISKADLILFLVDSKTGLLPQDKEMAELLKRIIPAKDRKKIMLTANKVDAQKISYDTAEFNKLGLGEPQMISAATGKGTGDLLDEVIKYLKKAKAFSRQSKKQEEKENIPVCILGKPNVGKSSLFNKLLGSEKVIVSDMPHTTREPNDMELSYKDKIITFIDTAGISKKGKQSKGLEKFGIEMSLKSLRRSNIALLVLDISQNITHQDARLVEEITKSGKSLMIIANKWDKIPEKNTKKYKDYIYGKLPFATWAPIQFASALTGSKVSQIMDMVIMLDEQRKIELGNSQLNRFLNKIVKIHKPTKGKGIKKPRIYELLQTGTNPPKFKVRIGSRDNLDNSYVRFIKNQLREKFGFLGSPIKINVANNPKIHGKAG